MVLDFMPDMEVMTMIAVINLSEIFFFGLILYGILRIPVVGDFLDRLLMRWIKHSREIRTSSKTKEPPTSQKNEET